MAYAAQVYVANTNQNDSLARPDARPELFAAYQALADAGVRAINNSWGSQPKDRQLRDSTLHAAYAQHYGAPPGWTPPASRQGVINVQRR